MHFIPPWNYSRNSRSTDVVRQGQGRSRTGLGLIVPEKGMAKPAGKPRIEKSPSFLTKMV
jgi:hypothetical protein